VGQRSPHEAGGARQLPRRLERAGELRWSISESEAALGFWRRARWILAERWEGRVKGDGGGGCAAAAVRGDRMVLRRILEGHWRRRPSVSHQFLCLFHVRRFVLVLNWAPHAQSRENLTFLPPLSEMFDLPVSFFYPFWFATIHLSSLITSFFSLKLSL
jgi:hypothetical protein